jgi:xylulokinase
VTLVAGVDSSTQATKVVVCDADTGAVVRDGRAPHPDATEVDPAAWWAAFERAADGLLDGVAAIAVGGQQHGMVCLDSDGAVVRPALLWHDTRSAPDALDLVAELGGPGAWAAAVGSVPVASFTVTKLRWLARAEPADAARVAAVLLPHDWLTHRLRASGEAPTTDRGDASGTGYWSPVTGEYRPDLVRLALGRDVRLPRVAGPAEAVGVTAGGALLAPGTGDNMAAALGLGLAPGDVVVSLGTSGTAFGVSGGPACDATGTVAGFADATGLFLPLVCTLNAARVLTAAADLLGRSLAEVDELALAAAPGAGGLTLLPYLDGERTPNLPDARGLLAGLTRANASPANVARAAVEGMLCGLADGLDALAGVGVPVRRVLLIGGASASVAVRAVAPGLFGVPVRVPRAAEYVALGAARQAAWVVRGGPAPPDWPVAGVDTVAPEPTEAIRRVYTDVRERARDLLTHG